jgi:hypothetical protein
MLTVNLILMIITAISGLVLIVTGKLKIAGRQVPPTTVRVIGLWSITPIASFLLMAKLSFLVLGQPDSQSEVNGRLLVSSFLALVLGSTLIAITCKRWARSRSAVDEQAVSASVTKPCPACAETIKMEALVCRFCAHKFSEAEVTQAKQLVETQAAERAARAELQAQREKNLRRRRTLAFRGKIMVAAGVGLILVQILILFAPRAQGQQHSGVAGFLIGLVVLWYGAVLIRKSRKLGDTLQLPG